MEKQLITHKEDTPSAPLVSIIIPFLNEDQFLSETIDSVLQQDYEKWELLLIDDGSTNVSTTIAKRYASAYPDKIFYLEHEGHINKGVCASRNLGVDKAKGNLIALLDADDVWLPAKLLNQVAIFQDHPQIGMVAEASNYWFSWDKPDAANVMIPVGAPQDTVYKPFELLYMLYPLNKGAAPCPSGLMMTKEAIIQIGGFEEAFTKQYQLYEDQAFLCKMYMHTNTYISSNCNNLYRQRTGSAMNWVREQGHYHAVRQYFLEWLAKYVQQQGIKDKRLWGLLRKALFPYHYPMLFNFTQTAPRKIVQKLKKAVPMNVKHFIKSRFSATG